MAQQINTDLGGIPNFECHGDSTSVGQRWKRAFELFVIGKGISDPTQKKALLLHCGRMDLQDIYFTLPSISNPVEQHNVYSIAMEQLENYFSPQTNVPYERHLFRNLCQHQPIPIYYEAKRKSRIL
ncbi:Uncharacterised protein g8732 [Pycnogonum litorale]